MAANDFFPQKCTLLLHAQEEVSFIGHSSSKEGQGPPASPDGLEFLLQ